MIHSNSRKWRETKEPLNEGERVGLRLNSKKIKITASGPITAWQTEGEMVDIVTDFLFLGSKINADGDCSHEIRWLLLGRKVMTNPDCVLKTRDIALLTKFRIVKAVVFLGHYSCENWTAKKAKHQSIDAFGLWCWRRLLKVPWTARRSNQSILRMINPDYSLEGLMLKLKLQYFGHMMCTDDSLEKSLMLGKIEGKGEEGIRGWDGWTVSPMQWTWTWANSGMVRDREAWPLQSMALQRVGQDWVTERQQSNSTCSA